MAIGLGLVAGGLVVLGLAGAAGAQSSVPDAAAARCDAGAEPSSFFPDDCWGTYPTSNYDIGADMLRSDPLRSMHYGMTQWSFNLGKGAVQLALWGVEWSLVGFDVRDHDDAAREAGSNFDTLLISHDELPFVPLAWLATFSWAGYRVLRGHLTTAGTEILLSFVLAGLFTVLVDDLGSYMDATWDLMDTTSSAVLVVAHGEDPAAGGADQARQAQVGAVERLQHDIHVAFVEVPYEYLNWGTSLGDADDADNELRACARVRDEVLADGPHGLGFIPQMEMRAAGSACRDLADFNAEPSWERTFGALLVMIASFVLAGTMLITVLAVVVAKLLLLAAFGVAPFAGLAAILPGQGRRLAWGWATAFGQLVVAVVVTSFVLSLLLLLTEGLLGMTASLPPLERFTVLLTLVLAVYQLRRRLLVRGHALAARVADWLATLPRPDRFRRGPVEPAPDDAGAAAWLPLAAVGALAFSDDAFAAGVLPDDGGPDLLEVDHLGGTLVGSFALATAGFGGASIEGNPNVSDDDPLWPVPGANLAAPAQMVGRTVAERWRERRWQHRRHRYFRRTWRWQLATFPYSRRTWMYRSPYLPFRRVPHKPHHPRRPVGGLAFWRPHDQMHQGYRWRPFRDNRVPRLAFRGRMIIPATAPRRFHRLARTTARRRRRAQQRWRRWL